MATGVLVVCTGKSTKKVQELMATTKCYEGIIRLGIRTNTDDAEGEAVEQCTVPQLEETDIDRILQGYIGTIDQIPPDFSAIRQNGVRLYRLARKGIKVDIPPRKVTIHEILLLEWNSPDIRIRVHCGKGTYIRSLARDIGRDLGTCGHLYGLRRLGVGDFHVDDAISLDSLKTMMSDHADVPVY